MAGDTSSNSNTNSHRLSRLAAKLLRRSSTSSAKNVNLNPAPATSPCVEAAPQPRTLPPSPSTRQNSPAPPITFSRVDYSDADAPDSPSSRVRSSRSTLEPGTQKSTSTDPASEKLLQGSGKTKAPHGQLEEISDSSSCGQAIASSTAPSSRSEGTTPPTHALSEPSKSGHEPVAAPKDIGASPIRSLSFIKSDSRSIRTLDAVDETARDANLPSPLSISVPRAVPPPAPPTRPPLAIRRQSLIPSSQQRLIKTLLEPSVISNSGGDYFSRPTPSIQPDMVSRKVWVKRAGASPTLVSVTEEDLVDDLREAILKKYLNSLGRTFDAPDILIKLIPREPSSRQSCQDRLLGPEEPVGRTLDNYYPGGQTVGEALIIEIPMRRTPRPSPRHNVSFHPEDMRGGEPDEYFPPMHTMQTPIVSGSISSASIPSSHPNSMSVITTGQLPTVPSPGSRGSWQNVQHRPKFARQPTSSPTMAGATPAVSNVNDAPAEQTVNTSVPAPASPVPTPPVPVVVPEPPKSVNTPPARVSSPRPTTKVRKMKKSSSAATVDSGVVPSIGPASLLDGTVPPISVLIVEDNSINMKILEAFMKRMRVRCQTAINGREALNKWRGGGVHLVLMDIQLPVMNGLEATREIRRLERVNSIGVFSKDASGVNSGVAEEDKLDKKTLFKSPVIIVALTASNLQSDRDEALAAGCNDFLTKPVNMMWLEKKVTEWGCMQALIDYEGWRKWRGFDNSSSSSGSTHSSFDKILDGPMTDSPAPQTAKEKEYSSFREPSPPPSFPKLPGSSVYKKKSGEMDSSTSSTSTIVPNGGNATPKASTHKLKSPTKAENGTSTESNPSSPSASVKRGRAPAPTPLPAPVPAKVSQA